MAQEALLHGNGCDVSVRARFSSHARARYEKNDLSILPCHDVHILCYHKVCFQFGNPRSKLYRPWRLGSSSGLNNSSQLCYREASKGQTDDKIAKTGKPMCLTRPPRSRRLLTNPNNINAWFICLCLRQQRIPFEFPTQNVDKSIELAIQLFYVS